MLRSCMGRNYGVWRCYWCACCVLLGAACDDTPAPSSDAGQSDTGAAEAGDAQSGESNCSIRLEEGSRLESEGAVETFAEDFTLEIWARVDSLEGSQNVAAADSGEAQLSLEYDARVAACSLRRGNVDARASLPLGTGWAGPWHHIACTRSAGELALWLDGIKAAFTLAPGRLGAPASLRLGAAPDGARAFEGGLDELRITPAVRYSEDFTPEPRDASGPPGTGISFHFDECSGSFAMDDAMQIKLEFEGDVSWTR